MAFLVGSTAPLSVQRLAVPAVCLLIAFLGYGSQILFSQSPDLEPGPLTPNQSYTFNTLLACLWYTYYKACTVDPGRYHFPPSVAKPNHSDDEGETTGAQVKRTGGTAATATASGGDDGTSKKRSQKRCKKCRLPKPPRSHHCRICGRCIPKMDHHCPWTSNCVSLQTFPHFLRFLVYTNLSLWTMLYFVFQRFQALWANRHLPAYLGPTLPQLIAVALFALVGLGTSLALGILAGRSSGTTLCSSVAEAGFGDDGGGGSNYDADGYWETRRDADDPVLFRLEPVEFPYDIGIFSNMAQAMGTANVLLWFFPFAAGPRVASFSPSRKEGEDSTGWEYEENGMNDDEGMWPPPDPAKMRHSRAWNERRRRELAAEREAYDNDNRKRNNEDQREAFRRRQEIDMRRWQKPGSGQHEAGRILGELEEMDGGGYEFVDDDRYSYENYQEQDQQDQPLRPGSQRGGVVLDEGKSGWVNADGEQLGDYGVDEDAEFDEDDEVLVEPVEDVEAHEDDDVPLAELIRRRKVLSRDVEDT
ncbi:DHHC zinc finger domain-containing protein [Apiospora kogelbergensis]|uniref:DHHC zinc finger domain-containing protein n=1 Tax=Apiospora kogelbergensis TaxID=1337665 RepID=UPI00313080F9